MSDAAQLFRESLLVLAVVGAPLFVALLVVGLIVGVVQATTQINDAAVGAIPRLVVAGAVCLLLGNWMVEHMARFLALTLGRMASP